jgi:uncharacterized repeat protein (TIGR02543 family)
MKYSGNIFVISMAVFGAYFAHGAIAAQNSPSAFSTYGLIQPVQKYSSNPFWNTNSPYNQRMPVPIYATGADLTSGDCNRVVENLVASYCASNNYCSDSRLGDVRPTVMVQLSQLPGHNFATSCGGYIDSVFEKYQEQHGNVSTGTVHYTATPTIKTTNTTSYENPLKRELNEYQIGVMERTAELEQLQRATTASPELEPTYFPKTTADLSFTDRVANTTAGYEQYKDLNPYKTPQFETDAEFYERLKTLNPTEYCRRFPNDVATCSKKIIYQLFGGTNAPDNPTYYTPGTGATISGVPTRANSVFVSWCTDSAMTNCAKTQIINKGENTDKIFFAKWDCINGYILQNNLCINPNRDNRGGEDFIPGGAENCPDPHMDANCQCTGIYAPSPNDPNICICADSTKDIANNCADSITPEPTGPQCLIKMSKNSRFMQSLANLLRNSTKLDANELKTKQLYAPIAQGVHLYCVDNNNASAQDFSEFNSWIDNHDTLPIRIPFNGRIETIDINAEDLFNYNDYSYSILMVYKTPYNVQTIITRDDVTFFSTDKKCVNYTNLAGAIDENYFSGTPAVRKAAKDIYGDRVYNISKSKISFFPGKLLYGSRSAGLNQVKVNNYITARKKIVNFWKNLKSEIDCQNKDIALYLVDDAVIDSAGRTQTVIIKSEPFFIP